MLNKPQLARKRNWMLLQLKGMHTVSKNVNKDTLNPGELEAFKSIENQIKRLIENWDGNSATLGLHLKPHKCEFCGKRSDRAYWLEDSNGEEPVYHLMCKKHSLEFADAPGTRVMPSDFTPPIPNNLTLNA
jgi:uncharacterized Zn-finger protein